MTKYPITMNQIQNEIKTEKLTTQVRKLKVKIYLQKPVIHMGDENI